MVRPGYAGQGIVGHGRHGKAGAMSEGEYSVWIFLSDDSHFPIERHVDPETAVKKAMSAAKLPGRAQRIIVTDGGDATCFEWQRKLGITFPPEAARKWP